MNVRTGNYFDEESHVFPVDQIREVERNRQTNEDDFDLLVKFEDGLEIYCDYLVFEQESEDA